MHGSATSGRYSLDLVQRLGAVLFEHAGLRADMSTSVSRALVTADAMGHTTHGMALVPWYLDALSDGQMRCNGEVEVLSDRGSCVAWQGECLPGAWLVEQAIDLALARVDAHGVVTVSIAGAHHIGALVVYLPRLTERGLMCILSCSGPAAGGVAPFGGTCGLLTPNPIACGIPTAGDPVLLDISASITTNNRARQLARAGARLPGAWVMDSLGVASDDPSVAVTDGGTLLPVGGIDHGHKGFAMALMVEALTQGLSGLGRHQRPSGMLTNVFLQVIDPGAFGGSARFLAESTWLVDACRSNPPRPGGPGVRIPGERGLQSLRAAAVDGLPLQPSIVDALSPYLERASLVWPPRL